MKRVHGERRWCGKGVLQLRRCEFEIVYALSAGFPVWRVCRVMGINRSGFYKWRDSVLRPSEKKKKREADIALFKEFHERFPSHGYRWLRAKIELDTGAVYSDNYAQRVCAYAGIRSVSKHVRRYRGTNRVKVYPNLLLADLAITRPMEVVVSDMTAFWANGKYWELTLYMDLYNNSIVSYAISPIKGDPKTYMEGLGKLLEKKKEYAGLGMILHSDQGAVYSSKSFNELLPTYDITRSMSRAGTPTDNGAMEAIKRLAQGRALLRFLPQRIGGRRGKRQGLRRIFQRKEAGLRPRIPDPKAVHGEVLRELAGRQERGGSRFRRIGRGNQKNGQGIVHFLLTSAILSPSSSRGSKEGNKNPLSVVKLDMVEVLLTRPFYQKSRSHRDSGFCFPEG